MNKIFSKNNKTYPRYNYKLIMCITSILIIISVPFAFSAPQMRSMGPPPLVKVARVEIKDVNPPAEYVGHVEAIQHVDLIARVNGFLEQVNFKEGDYVHEGDLLYVIEQQPYKVAFEAARARVAQAKATLEKITKHLRRLKAVRSGGVPITEIEDAEADKLKAVGVLKEAKANLETARINLGYTEIYAPISGQIGKTFYTKGNFVDPSSGPLARIVQLDPIRVVYSISENNLSLIKKALNDSRKKKNLVLNTSIVLPNGQPYKKRGHIEFVNNEIDPETATVEIRSIFRNQMGILLPGMFVKVLIKRSKPKLMPVVPQSAVLFDNKGHFVLLVDKTNHAIRKRIKLGKTIGINWIVTDGLSGGETIIIEGLQKVFPGMLVRTSLQRKKRDAR